MNRRWLVLLLSWLCGWGLIVSPSRGEPPRPAIRLAPEQFRRVAADSPSNWPPGDWRPVSRTQLDEFLRAGELPPSARSEPARTLWSAHYRGKFASGELAGECEFTIRDEVESDALILLHPLSMRWHSVTWGDTPAVFGTRLDGKTLLQPQPGRPTGRARWELPGQRIFDRWEFALQMPAAGINQLTLDLPSDLMLQSSAGVVEGPAPADADGWRRWTVHAGRRVSLKLSCVPAAEPAANAKSLLRESHIATLQGEGADLVSDYELAAGDSPGQLLLEIPPELKVLSVTGGAEARLAFQVKTEGDTRRLSVAWPATPREPRLRVRSFGVVDWSRRDAVTLPLPQLLRDWPVERQLTVHVRPPLQLQAHDGDGFRVMDRRLDVESTETWTFQAIDPAARMQLRLSTPSPSLSAQVATLADYRQEVATIRSQLRVAGGGGPTFEVRTVYPAAWDVTAVSTVAGSSTSVAGFHVTSGPSPLLKTLTIDLLEPLRAGEEFLCRVEAVAAIAPWGQPFPIPSLRLFTLGNTEGTIGLIPADDTELVGELPPLSAAPDERALKQLTALANNTNWGGAIFFDQSGIDRAGPLPTIAFEPATGSRDPMSGNVDPPESPPESSPDDRQLTVAKQPVFAQLLLTSQLASQGANSHRHTAMYQLKRRFDGVVQFQLSPVCSHVRLAIDGVPTRLVQTASGAWQSLQSVAAEQHVSLQYETPAVREGFVRHEAIPAAKWESDPPLKWRLVPTPTRACTGVDLPFASITQHERFPWTVRCFGPLARPDSITEPSHDELAPSRLEVDPDRTPSDAWMTPGRVPRGIIALQAASTPDELRLSTWNPQRAEPMAWALLMATLTVGVVLRRLRWGWWRRISPFVLLGLIGATWLAPDSCARLSGGCLIGFILAVTLPRRLLLPSTVRSPAAHSTTGPSGSSLVRLTASAPVVLVAISLATGRPAVSQQLGESPTVNAPTEQAASRTVEVLLPEQDGEATETAYVSSRIWSELTTWQAGRESPTSWMLAEAEYEVSLPTESDDTEVEVVGRYGVLVQHRGQRTAVRLGLGQVTFQSVDAVTVDGEPVTIIPASQGEAIIVLIEPADQIVDRADPSPWTRHAVEFRCRTAVREDGPLRGISIQVPPAAAAQVRWNIPPELRPGLTIPGLSAMANSTDVLTSRLGAQSVMAAEWRAGAAATQPAERAPAYSAAVTQLDVGPLRRQGTTTVELSRTDDRGRQAWSLPLNPGLIVRRVRVPADFHYRVRGDRSGPILDLLALQPIVAAPVVTIETMLATAELPTAGGSAPLFGVMRQVEGVGEWITVRPQTGFTAQVQLGGVPARGASLPTDLSAEVVARLEGVAQEFHRVKSGESWLVKVAPQTTARRATADTRVRVDRPQTHWVSHVTMDVLGAATPVHRLRLGSSVRVDRVVAMQDGVDRLARFIRDGDRLDLVLSRAYSGPLEIEISGQLPLSTEDAQPLPQLEIVDGGFVSTISEITNESRWTAEIVRAQAGPTRLTQSSEGLVSTDVDPDPPISFRLISGPDAISAEQTVLFVRDPQGGWQQRITLELRPNGVALGSVPVRIPAAWGEKIRVTPAADVQSNELDVDGWRTLRLHPSRLRGGGYLVQLQAPIDVGNEDEIWQYTPLQLPRAQLRRSRLGLPADFPYRPTSATTSVRPVEPEPALGGRVRRFERTLLTEVAADASVWSFKVDRPDAAEISVPLLESSVWLDDSRGVRITSWLTIVTQRSAELDLQLPDQAQVNRVSYLGTQLPWTIDGRRLRLSLPDDLSDGPVTVEWSLRSAWKQGRAIPLLTGAGWNAGETLATLIPCGGSQWRLPSIASPLEVIGRRMSGLVAAAEQQSTKTFTLDSPLLASIRRLEGDLDRGLRAPGVPASLQRECADLKSRWQRVHQLIAVESSPPGAGTSASRPNVVEGWLQPASAVRSDMAVLTSSPQALPLQPDSPRWSRQLAAGLLAVGVLLIIGLQRWSRLANPADWFATRPDLVCLLLGGFWTWLLQPRLLGAVLILTGVALWSRRRRRLAPPTDTALIGPGR